MVYKKINISNYKKLIKTDDYLNKLRDKMLEPNSKFIKKITTGIARTKTVGRLNAI